ncbi:16S rRNA (guanine(527)-N(7))-methyltransferase RsmG [Halomonas urumqiensis]|uniref:Ribosomal RNA small subunit methyltransferase G n=1 Tax=Halomonas urumqiensis TaxID=1684789 RepID=A0A2N7UJZ7_9GAMM|nr:16S rRNA (guanine(527)-N(7))-methyltransferase RsmG [Halomonas urumqiensis]PMR80767.1 16S rRNA (guanine(527)-N(7))-methyltransferase RsmG [Halomonas urumqiensis]PTB02725.1 16S rRNA (guanine(527)-N(7))-methyltransferase RsmG [Halomonas urumqiensis]GHE21223.1 ribosomal RNA small subunit methyltransferase G [Halomonas urumqiensis]
MTAVEQQSTARLDEGLERLGIEVDSRQREQLLGLLGLLHKWNRAYNLTAIRSVEEMVPRHLLDSAAVLPHVHGPRLLDVGTGPGLPGLVLAILAPTLAVTLLDSNGKKVRFQRQAVMELGLTNVTPVQARVEAFSGQFDQVISRAFASLGDFVALTEPLVAPGGQWLAMKGPAVESELVDLPPGIEPVERYELAVPFDVGNRLLVRLERRESALA